MILAVQVVIYTIYFVVSLVLIYVVTAAFFNFQMGGWLSANFSWRLSVGNAFNVQYWYDGGGISPNSQIASVIASLLYFWMLIFSGATLPYQVMPSTLQKVANILPLTQGIKILKAASLGLPIFKFFTKPSILYINDFYML